jgi:hypothetical protein
MSRPSNNPSVSRERKLEELKDNCLTLFISGMIGGLVALPFYLWYRAPLLPGAAQGALAGMLIGLVSRTGFVLVQRRLHSSPFWAFAFIFLTIGCGTWAGAYLLGLRDMLPFVLLIASAEAAGLTVTFLKYRYSQMLNHKLHILQQKIRSESDDR